VAQPAGEVPLAPPAFLATCHWKTRPSAGAQSNGAARTVIIEHTPRGHNARTAGAAQEKTKKASPSMDRMTSLTCRPSARWPAFWLAAAMAVVKNWPRPWQPEPLEYRWARSRLSEEIRHQSAYRSAILAQLKKGKRTIPKWADHPVRPPASRSKCPAG